MRASLGRRRAAVALAGGALVAAAFTPATAQAAAASPDAQLTYGIGSAGSDLSFTTLTPVGGASTITNTAAGGGGAAYDSAGDLFYDTGTAVLERAAGSSTSTQVASGLTAATSLAVDPSGNVFVNDGGALKRIAATSHTVTTVDASRTLLGIATDSTGDVLAVANASGTYSVVKYAAGAGPGTTFASLGSAVSSGIAVGPDQSVYVAQSAAQKVVHLSSTGTALADALTGSAFDQVAADKAGNLYTTSTASGTHTLNEYPAGTTTARTLVSSSTPLTSLAPTPYTVSTPKIRTSRVRHGSTAFVSAVGFKAGEAFTVSIHGRILGRGTANSTGYGSARARAPRCLGGAHYLKVTSASGGFAVVKLTFKRKVNHGCHGLK